ncbi:MAG: Iron-sulfur cluster carrier protein [Alphaproteobacteria bacterium MarineAlpha9_Bin4]|nr:ATP-binding protein [Pelagibacterales bacterium]PPR26804.1 MAG: Iron-sulfur cluster carrier protein [Alphaproteobacteria bacterium MarineAlpha9_Bin4]|tara:strand:- start:3659 stop:4618 length:960 start_codon:yes stop_codon:yes gene_type:complete
MNDKNQKLINSLISSFSVKLKPLVNDFVIRDNKAFITLKAKDYDDAKNLERYKKECEEILKNKNIFDEIFISFTEKEELFNKVIAISSCKGGVGKSTIAVNLALALKRLNYSVGLLDADIYGPSVPKLLKISAKPEVDEKKKIIPVTQQGLKVMSIGLLIEEEKPIIWRGPMIQGALTQLIEEVKWGKLDFLVVDLPPGTGDAYLAVLQKLKIDYSLIVTTSQDLAIADTKKGINLMLKFNIPVTGIIENMSYFECDHCSEPNYIFGKNGVEDLAKQFNTKVVAKLPIISEFEEGLKQNNSKLENKEKIFNNLAENLIN